MSKRTTVLEQARGVEPEPIEEKPLPFEPPWGKRELAAYLGVTISCVDKMIASKRHPPGFKAGRLWRWRPQTVRAWAEAQERSTV